MIDDLMNEKPFTAMARLARRQGRRLAAPLVGFPGLNMTGCTVKLAQQNYGEHYKVLKLLAETFEPDVLVTRDPSLVTRDS